LTADDGTWVKVPDFKDRMHVLLLFVADLDDPESIRAVRAVDRERDRLEALDVAVFGVSTRRTDALRSWRATHALETPFLYDPLAAAARGYRASGRVRPSCVDTVVLVGKSGRIVLAERGFPPVERPLAAAAREDGRDVPPPPAREEATERPSTTVRDITPLEARSLLDTPEGGWLLIDVRTRAEFDAGHAPNARHIPVDELPHRHAELGQARRLIFVCAAGGRSAQASEFMVSVGATEICNVVGGMSEWGASQPSGEVSGG
jgi:rhodanese-related sulfurtransferase/peroxiredoxin